MAAERVQYGSLHSPVSVHEESAQSPVLYDMDSASTAASTVAGSTSAAPVPVAPTSPKPRKDSLTVPASTGGIKSSPSKPQFTRASTAFSAMSDAAIGEYMADAVSVASASGVGVTPRRVTVSSLMSLANSGFSTPVNDYTFSSRSGQQYAITPSDMEDVLAIANLPDPTEDIPFMLYRSPDGAAGSLSPSSTADGEKKHTRFWKQKWAQKHYRPPLIFKGGKGKGQAVGIPATRTSVATIHVPKLSDAAGDLATSSAQQILKGHQRRAGPPTAADRYYASLRKEQAREVEMLKKVSEDVNESDNSDAENDASPSHPVDNGDGKTPSVAPRPSERRNSRLRAHPINRLSNVSQDADEKLSSGSGDPSGQGTLILRSESDDTEVMSYGTMVISGDGGGTLVVAADPVGTLVVSKGSGTDAPSQSKSDDAPAQSKSDDAPAGPSEAKSEASSAQQSPAAVLSTTSSASKKSSNMALAAASVAKNDHFFSFSPAMQFVKILERERSKTEVQTPTPGAPHAPQKLGSNSNLNATPEAVVGRGHSVSVAGQVSRTTSTPSDPSNEAARSASKPMQTFTVSNPRRPVSRSGSESGSPKSGSAAATPKAKSSEQSSRAKGAGTSSFSGTESGNESAGESRGAQ
jgi:hypothetical protein